MSVLQIKVLDVSYQNNCSKEVYLEGDAGFEGGGVIS